jgi:hypothetical protein
MAEEVKEARIHPWVYYIAPVGNTLVFTAFCKACRQYFTEGIPWRINFEPLFTESHLPRYGCEPISEDVSAL